MGCWNATCNISHLPIRHSERIVVIPLISTAFPKNTNTCYVSDNFQQMALPIRGEYNDYGGIENIEISPENEALIRSYEFYKLKDDNAELDKNNVENYVLVEQPNDIQECINNIMDAGEKYYVKYAGIYVNARMLAVDYFIVHEELYDMLVKEISSRRPYNKQQNIKTLMFNKYKTKIDTFMETDTLFKEMKENKEKIEPWVLSEITRTLFCNNTYAVKEYNWNILTKMYIESKNESIIEMAVEKSLFGTALDLLRMGFHCTSGAGSQSLETRMHFVLASYIMQHIENYANQMREYNDYSEEEIDDMRHGVEETIFYYKN